MPNQIEQFNNILIIVLIFLVIILAVLAVVYFYMKSKESKPLKEDKNKLKKQEENKPTKNATIQTLNKQSIMKFMEFDKIEDNMIVQKGGKRFVMVVECQGINYDLMSEMEKNAVEEGFIQFLNTLRHPIQIYVQTRTVNLGESIQRYKTNLDEIEMELHKKEMQYNEIKQSENSSQEDIDKVYFELTKKRNLYEYGKDIIKNTEKMSLNKSVLTKKYYIVIHYYSEDADKEEYTKEEIQNMAFSELYTKSQSIIRTLFACSVSGKILNSYELVELLYNAYNREQAEVFGLNKAVQAGYEELYSTAPDVVDKKIKVLDEQIQKDAMNMARQEVEKVRSEREKEYNKKQNSMEQLIKDMAKMILEENQEYIGKDIIDEALENLDKQDEDEATKNIDKLKKGGNQNVEEEKPKAKRRGRPRKQKAI